jgi:hypothetical protein
VIGMGAVLAAVVASLGPAVEMERATPAQVSQPDAAVVWAVGDGADGSAAAKRVARLISRDRPERMLYLGDVYERGTSSEFRRNFGGVYGRLARLTEPTPGNHEWAGRRVGYYPYWKRIKGRTQEPWYRLSVGGWEILSLNSQAAHGPRSNQLRWLRARLRGARGTCRLAFWHRPRYNAGLHGDAPDVAPLWNAIRGRSRLVLNGHDHNLQRLRRREGITQFVIGAGGRARYRVRRGDDRAAFARDDVNGALRMVLTPGSATLEVRAATGKVLDRTVASCRTA